VEEIMNSMLKPILMIAVLIPAASAVLYTAFCFLMCWALTTPFDPVIQMEPNPAIFGLEYEDVRFPARNDGLTIAGWYLPNPESTSAIILIHGKDENRASAMSGTFLSFAVSLHDAGFAVLMIDMRGHGLSQDAHYDFGMTAKNDVLGAVDFLLDKGYQPGNIGALGISLGGAAVNYAAAEEPAIGAVVADSTFADTEGFVTYFWTHRTRMPAFFLPGIYLSHQVMYGYDLRVAAPIEAVSSMQPRPYLIIHSTSDESIPIKEAERLAEAAIGSETWYVDTGCEHAQINTEIPDEYEAHVISFFKQNLP
jgi:dipeptidyl aminopeptidase/acylaminoacyl peptidase